MPGGFLIFSGLCNSITLGADTANSKPGNSLTPGTSAFSNGAWTQLTASLAIDACWVSCEFINANGEFYVIDIGVGASGSEALIARFPFPNNTQSIGSTKIGLPLEIPAGSRVAIRAAADAFGRPNVPGVQFRFFEGDFTGQGAAGADLVGAVAGTNFGVTVTPSATANTKGSWAQLIASTARDYDGFIIAVSTSGSSANPSRFLMDVGIGASGSEQVIVADFYMQNTQFQSKQPHFSEFVPMQIPAGTRIAFRIQEDNTNANTATAMLVGVYK